MTEIEKLKHDNKALLDELKSAYVVIYGISGDDLSNDALLTLGSLSSRLRAAIEHSEPQ